jgi:hypothetical protein
MLLTLAVFAFSACAPRAGQGEVAQMPGAEQFAVDLPAIVLDIDAEGNPSLAGAPLAQLGASLGASGLQEFSLPADVVARLTGANVQHIQINNTASGLRLLVNGQEIPSLAWDGESLQTAQGFVGSMGGSLPAGLDALLPSIGKLGVGVILRFPPGQGAELIPLEVTGEGSAAAEAEAATAAYLESVGDPAMITIPIFYEADGGWTVAGMTDAEWTALTGQSFWSALRLPPDTIASLSEAGVTEMTLSTDSEGLHLAVNGNPLPHLSWGGGKLNYVIDLASGAGLLDAVAAGEEQAAAVEAIKQLLPILTSSNVTLHVILPQ